MTEKSAMHPWGAFVRFLKRTYRYATKPAFSDWVVALASVVIAYYAYTQQRNTMIDERPWIGLVKYAAPIQAGKQLDVKMVIANLGKTPVSHMKMVVSFDIIPDREIKEDEILKRLGTRADTDTYDGDMMNPTPSDERPIWDFPFARTISQDEWDRFQRGELTFYGFESITYDDVFGRHLWTRFCKQITGFGEQRDCPNGVWYATKPE